MSDKDGGPAFPHPEYEPKIGAPKTVNGMTLRDYFAAQAVTAFRLNYSLSWTPRKLAECQPEFVAEQVAKGCYELADAMLAERAKSAERQERESA